MRDRFLHDHCRTPLVVDLGGNIHPISIRDQMIRSRYAVDRMVEHGWIGEGRPVLVIGGGAAGATAAICAALLGIEAVLVEQQTELFGVQSLCLRHVDPVQYDWPAEHWSKGTVPPDPSGQWQQPLPFSGASAQVLARVWNKRVQDAEADLAPYLTVYRNARLVQLDDARVPMSVPRRSPAGGAATRTVNVRYLAGRFKEGTAGLGTPLPPTGDRYGGVIDCRGHGRERCHAGRRRRPAPDQYQGPSFWGGDRFDEPDAGVPSGRPVVVISGGGDGALQDLIRLATGLSSAKAVVGRLGLKPDLLAALYSRDDQAQRELAFAHARAAEHAVLDALHAAFLDAAERLLVDDPSVGSKLDGLLDHGRSVQLVHGCTHFERCYALNRFLALVIDAHVRRQSGGSAAVLVRELTAIHVDGLHAGPCGQPAVCHGQDHRVWLAAKPTCGGRAGRKPVRHADANVVVIRHGLAKLGRGRPRVRVRQLLPYYLQS